VGLDIDVLWEWAVVMDFRKANYGLRSYKLTMIQPVATGMANRESEKRNLFTEIACTNKHRHAAPLYDSRFPGYVTPCSLVDT
jgi:hypothetical protein